MPPPFGHDGDKAVCGRGFQATWWYCSRNAFYFIQLVNFSWSVNNPAYHIIVDSMEHIYEPKLTPLNTMYMAEKYKFLPNFREFFRFKEMQNGITDQSQKSRLYPRQDEASRDFKSE